MKIHLNGDVRELPAPMTVTGLLAHLNVDPRVVAVEVNRVVIKKAAFPDTPVPAGAEVEIVSFVGGG